MMSRFLKLSPFLDRREFFSGSVTGSQASRADNHENSTHFEFLINALAKKNTILDLVKSSMTSSTLKSIHLFPQERYIFGSSLVMVS